MRVIVVTVVHVLFAPVVVEFVHLEQLVDRDILFPVGKHVAHVGAEVVLDEQLVETAK
jgi:hypothetical protein